MMTAEALLKRQSGGLFHVSEKMCLDDCIGVMIEKNVGAVVVLDDDKKLRGIISERDILRCMHEHMEGIREIPVSEAMTPESRLIGVQKDDHVANVMDKMTANSIRHILIFDGDTFRGLASIRDVVQILLDNALLENKQLMDYVYQAY
ncbi:MAG: CBS domain-containing protein [Spirochaetota bacterium]